jgi:hypothetical protein
MHLTSRLNNALSVSLVNKTPTFEVAAAAVAALKGTSLAKQTPFFQFHRRWRYFKAPTKEEKGELLGWNKCR